MGAVLAVTEADIVSRVLTVCRGLGYIEAVGWEFERQPTTQADGTFTVKYTAATPIGGIGLREEARGTVLVSVLRVIRASYHEAHAQVLADARRIVSAVVRDGSMVSDYAVEDGGRSLVVDAPRGANHLIGRLGLPVNFEVAL